MNPVKAPNAIVTFSNIKNFAEIKNYFQNFKKPSLLKDYDSLHCLMVKPKNCFEITFFENPKLKIFAGSMFES